MRRLAASVWRSWKLGLLGIGRGWKPRLHGEAASQCRIRVVEEREASAAAVAKALCEPSEFHSAVYRCSPGHILQ